MHKKERGFPLFYPQVETFDPRRALAAMAGRVKMADATVHRMIGGREHVQRTFRLLGLDLPHAGMVAGQGGEQRPNIEHHPGRLVSYQQRRLGTPLVEEFPVTPLDGTGNSPGPWGRQLVGAEVTRQRDQQ